ncbi:transient receptor potential cation channel subfamily M member 8-like [Symsagittifera roscoffensis]|uniref:transient receptor potential cation channel subfamily M member 8-like n=1 Tax=Symsagittifera roscoffensis TaxID=84072 RepID=UPI00307BC2B4
MCYKEVPPLKPALKSGSNRTSRGEIDSEKRCQCGYLKEEHDPQALNRNRDRRGRELPWNYYEDTEKRATDAYGQVLFPGQGSEPPKTGLYVRLTPDTSYKDLVTLCKDGLKAKYPQMVLSVWGAESVDVTMPERPFQNLKQAVLRIAAQSGSWVITKGINRGVSEVVGQAYADYYSDRGLGGVREDQKSQQEGGNNAPGTQKGFPLIGVCTYGMLSQSADLEAATDEQKPAVLRPFTGQGQGQTQLGQSQGQEEVREISASYELDPNHKYFLMVDNGTYRKPDQDSELRLKLMDAISKYSPSRDTEGKRSDKRLDFNSRRVPVLNVIVGGNLSVFTAISLALQYKMPCLLVRNSGGVADFLDAVIRKLPQKRLNLEEDEARSTLIRKLFTECSSNEFLRQMKSTLKAEQWREFMEVVLDMVQSKHLLNFIDLSGGGGGAGGSSVGEIEDMLLEQVMTGKMSAYNRVNLALNLNKDGSTRSLKDAFQNLEKDEMLRLMMSATLRDRPKFTQNFIRYSGASLQEFLNASTLLAMYRQSDPTSIFARVYHKVMGSPVDGALLRSIGTFLSKLLNNSYNIEVFNNDQNIGPERHLFLFSLLQLQEQSMEFYWKESVGGTGSALLACRYLRAIAHHSELDDEPEEQKRLLQLATTYEQKAINTVEQCSKDNEIRTLKLLTYRQDIWFQSDLIEVADQSDSTKFIASEHVQEVLDWKWLGRMSKVNPKLLVYLTIFLPFLALFLKFDADPEASEKEVDKGNEVAGGKPKRKRVRWYKKIRYFYSAPLVKMLLYYTSFVLFVVGFGYVILYEQQINLQQFNPFEFNSNGNFGEFLVMIYVLTLVIEEVRQMFSSSSDPLQKNLGAYFGSFWNWIDVLAILLFVPGAVLRWFFYDGNTPSEAEDLQIAARSLYIFSLLSFMMRLVHCLSLSETIGPKILMLSKMTGDLVFFVVSLVVFMFSFGTAINAFLYPTMGRNIPSDSTFVEHVIRSIVDHTYWPAFGEVYQVAAEMGIPSDCDPSVSPYGGCQSSETYEFLAACVYAVYVFLVNFVLVNLLVAMMVYSFNKTQKDADEEYKIEKFRFQKEFYHKPPLPLPLSPLIIIYRAVNVLYLKATKKYSRCSMAIYVWERQNKRDMLVVEEERREKEAGTGQRLSSIEDRLNYLVSKVEGSEETRRTQLSVMESLQTLQKSINDMSVLVTAILPPSAVQQSGPNRRHNHKYIKALTNIELRVTGHSSSSDDEEETSGVYSDQPPSFMKEKQRQGERERSREVSRERAPVERASSVKSERSNRGGDRERAPSQRSKVPSDKSGSHTSSRHWRSIGVGRTPNNLNTEESQLSSSTTDQEDSVWERGPRSDRMRSNRYLLDQQVPRQPARYITEPGPAPVPTPTPAPEPAGRGGYQNLDQQPPNNNAVTTLYDENRQPIILAMKVEDSGKVHRGGRDRVDSSEEERKRGLQREIDLELEREKERIREREREREQEIEREREEARQREKERELQFEREREEARERTRERELELQKKQIQYCEVEIQTDDEFMSGNESGTTAGSSRDKEEDRERGEGRGKEKKEKDRKEREKDRVKGDEDKIRDKDADRNRDRVRDRRRRSSRDRDSEVGTRRQSSRQNSASSTGRSSRSSVTSDRDGEGGYSSTTSATSATSKETETALARQEALLEKLLQSQDQTNESMKERMGEAQENLGKLMNQLNASSKNKQELDSRLKRLDNRLETALGALETYTVDESNRDRVRGGTANSYETGSLSGVPRQSSSRGSNRMPAPSRHYGGTEGVHDTIPEEARSSYSRTSSRGGGGYTATYEDTSQMNRRQTAQKENVSNLQGGSAMGGGGEGGVGGEGVFPNIEYERQSIVSQIPLADQVSIHSHSLNTSARREASPPPASVQGGGSRQGSGNGRGSAAPSSPLPPQQQEEQPREWGQSQGDMV